MRASSNFKLVSSLLVLAFFGPLSISLAGGIGTGGGDPVLLKQVDVRSDVRKFAKKIEVMYPEFSAQIANLANSTKILSFEGRCGIVEIRDDVPKRTNFLRLKDGTIILNPSVFELSLQDQERILYGLIDSSRATVHPLQVTEIRKTGRIKIALDNIREQLNSKIFQSWLSTAYNEELDRSKFYLISEPDRCFVNANNQAPNLLDQGYVVGVRGFTQAKAGANIYFSNEILDYGQLGMLHLIAAEVGHHLPIGKEAENEATVDALAAVLTVGAESIDSQATMFNLQSKLMFLNIFAKNNIELPDVTQPTEHERKDKIIGEIPPAIRDLRAFLQTEEVANRARWVFNGFNRLLGEIKMSSLRDCGFSSYFYAGVHYDRMVNRTFETRKPTEMEEIKLQLSRLDSEFCGLVNDVFGKTFIEYDGYGTSYLSHAEKECLALEPNWRRTIDLKGVKISAQKRENLSFLDQHIYAFKKVLCEGVLKYYSRGTPFRGTDLEREMILAVIAGDASKVRELLKLGVSRDLKDSREKYDEDYQREGEFGVFFRTYVSNESLSKIAEDALIHPGNERFSEVLKLLK
jgi:hypothetical protein